MGPPVWPDWGSDRAGPSSTVSRTLSWHRDSHPGGKHFQESGRQSWVGIPVPGGDSLFLRGQAPGLPTLCPALDSRPGVRASRRQSPEDQLSAPPREAGEALVDLTQALCFPLKVNIYTFSTMLLCWCRGHHSGRGGGALLWSQDPLNPFRAPRWGFISLQLA